MKYPKGMKILHKKIRGCSDSFWYEGDIATYRGYTLIAAGEIRFCPVDFKKTSYADWHDIAREAKNDKGLRRLVCNEGETKAPHYWVNNNWFEVLLPDGSDVMCDVAYDYDDAIELLKSYAKEKV